jgi:hypothetical protein
MSADDMLSFASFLGDLVGSLVQFTQHRKERTQVNLHEFIRYLHDRQREDLAALIEGNEVASSGLASLLSRQTSEIRERLDSISGLLASVVAQFPDVAGVGLAFRPNAALSQQARTFLTQLYEFSEMSPGASLLVVPTLDRLEVQDGCGHDFDVSDLRYVHEDIDSLLAFSLIRPAPYVRDGFILTRQGETIARALLEPEGGEAK